MTSRADTQVLPVSSASTETIYPITKDRVPTDEVHIVPTAPVASPEDINGFEDITEVLGDILGLSLVVEQPAPTFAEQYCTLYSIIQQHLLDNASVWVNTTEEPEAATLAANTLVFEDSVSREQLSMYRVRDGEYTPLPMVPDPSVITGVGVDILTHLAEGTDSGSITQLGIEMCTDGITPSYRSKIQYNVSKLAEGGFVDLIHHGNSQAPRLSQMGDLWVRTHFMEATP